jgi:hypothetical protein
MNDQVILVWYVTERYKSVSLFKIIVSLGHKGKVWTLNH